LDLGVFWEIFKARSCTVEVDCSVKEKFFEKVLEERERERESMPPPGTFLQMNDPM
jgi:hypothetical protein